MRPYILTLGIITSAAAAGAVFLASGSNGGVTEETGAWSLLAAVDIEEVIEGENYQAIKTFPPALVDAAEGFEITGYVVPITAEPYMTTFMLVEDPANCPFCGSSAGYGPVLEVQLKRAIPELAEFAEIRVAGRIELIKDPETYQSYRLVDAIALNTPS